MLLLVYRNAFRKLPGWTDNINGAVALAAMLACTGIAVHSLVDFNLQVPANAAWFYVMAVLAASEDPLEIRQRVRRLRPQHLEDGFGLEGTPEPQENGTS